MPAFSQKWLFVSTEEQKKSRQVNLNSDFVLREKILYEIITDKSSVTVKSSHLQSIVHPAEYTSCIQASALYKQIQHKQPLHNTSHMTAREVDTPCSKNTLHWWTV